eukprot:4194844-Lingulodinium_polyedra.AAC.1
MLQRQWKHLTVAGARVAANNACGEDAANYQPLPGAEATPNCPKRSGQTNILGQCPSGPDG